MAKTRDKVPGRGEQRQTVRRARGHDEELRDNVKAAFEAAREVYDELIGNRGVTTVATRVATDKDIQDKLREARRRAAHAADRVQGKKEHSGRNATLLIAGIALGILFNPVTGPATRKWLADAVFGGTTTSRTRARPATARQRRTQPRPRSPAFALADRLDAVGERVVARRRRAPARAAASRDRDRSRSRCRRSEAGSRPARARGSP